MANLKSEKIHVFPTPNRGTDYQPQARLVTEFNLTNIVNRLVDKDSFVISYDDTPAGNENNITFNIHGYWIKADLKESGLSTDSDLYARIQVKGSDFIELYGTDEEYTSDNDKYYKYTGVEFLTSDPGVDAGGYYSLKLLEKVKVNDSWSWQVPADSCVRFTTNASTRSVIIDDGDLDE